MPLGFSPVATVLLAGRQPASGNGRFCFRNLRELSGGAGAERMGRGGEEAGGGAISRPPGVRRPHPRRGRRWGSGSTRRTRSAESGGIRCGLLSPDVRHSLRLWVSRADAALLFLRLLLHICCLFSRYLRVSADSFSFLESCYNVVA